nr:hypothetical protein [Dictyobacter vulcani]
MRSIPPAVSSCISVSSYDAVTGDDQGNYWIGSTGPGFLFISWQIGYFPI